MTVKRILVRKFADPQKGIKRMSISQKTIDKECYTLVRKSFIYNVSRVHNKNNYKNQSPQICIKKVVDTKKKIEKFTFRVNGRFYITYNRKVFEVYFQHRLNIQISWKSEISSPQEGKIVS